MRTALLALGTDAGAAAVESVVERLRSADASEVESSAVDTDAQVHRRAHAAWYAAAGVDDELARAPVRGGVRRGVQPLRP